MMGQSIVQEGGRKSSKKRYPLAAAGLARRGEHWRAHHFGHLEKVQPIKEKSYWSKKGGGKRKEEEVEKKNVRGPRGKGKNGKK